MDPINAWLDPIEVRRLADRLMQPDRAPAATVPDTGFGGTFQGFAAEPAAKAPLPPNPPLETTPCEEPLPAPSAAAAQAPFADHIQPFRDWLRQEFSATGIFILDREGVVLFDEGSHGRLHFLARSLALESRRPGPPTGNVRVKIAAGATLEVIPVGTAYGFFVLGAVVPEALSPASVTAVMEALAGVVTPAPEG